MKISGHMHHLVQLNQHTLKYLGVKYYLQQQPRISCDEVCQSRGLLCTAEDHGFTNENVLSIFASLLPSPCKTDFSNTDRWGEGGPSYLNHTDGHKRAGRCYGVKSIPKQILCGKVPSQPTTVRLCPCINGKGYFTVLKTKYREARFMNTDLRLVHGDYLSLTYTC